MLATLQRLVTAARLWFSGFERWYNEEHHHNSSHLVSGIEEKMF